MIKTLHFGDYIRKAPTLFFMLVLLLYASNSKAQSFIPSYVFTPTIPGPYVPITTGPVLGTGTVDDDTYTGMNIGFPFVYDNITYTTFSLNANGYVRLGNSMDGSRFPMSDGVENVLSPMTEDLQGTNTGEIRYDTFGIAPNRKLVVQFKDWGFYNRNGNDSFDFQIVLHETTNTIDFIYGRFFKTGDDYVQVGITGNMPYEFINRQTDDDWNATISSGSPYDACFLSDVGPVVPFTGLMYTFTPPSKQYNYSIVDAGPAIGVAPGTTDQVVARLKVSADGIASYLPLTSLTVNTTGTTNLASISNIKVYYTGLTPTFATTVQFGSTVSSPAASNIVTDSINLATGDNYFWITYDISPSAVLGGFVDATVPSLVVANTTQIPVVTSPAGNRVISLPMTYLTSMATQNVTTKVGRGSDNNQIIGLTVVTSSTGAAASLTQFDLDATGTTDTSNIKNIKVWYTGKNKTFATNTQFGTTLAKLPGSYSFSVTGNQTLFNDTNYFWLTYDIVDTATVTNLVDASCNSITVGGNLQVPAVTSPVGAREIRNNYCTAVISNASNACNWGYYISAVATYGAENDIVNYTGCNGGVNNYIYYSNKTLTAKQNQNISIELGDYSSWITYAVWIDYNQDGAFDNVTERVFQGSTVQNEGYVSGNFTIPCTALPGNTRMRVRGGDYWWFASPITDPCSDVGIGETEDYNVEIISNPISIASLEPTQHTGTVGPGTVDKVILEVPITTDGCGLAINSTMKFSTTGTTATSNIINAKLYRTPKATFNTSNLVGTVASPSGQFTFTLSDTLETAGTTFYWLAYDISASATLSTNIDARFDSIETLGSYHKPVNGNPSGNIQIIAPMTYLSSTTLQSLTQKVGRGTADNEILSVRVITSAVGSAAYTTQMDFDANGTTDTANIVNLKVWYTGSKNSFSADNQFGSTLAHLPGTMNFTVSGNQELTNDTNYFWLTYDIVDTAALANLVDGSCNGITIASIAQIPTTTSPTGSREIREDYCDPLASNPNSCNWGYYISAVSTYGAESDIYSYSGCNGNVNNYIRYTDQTLTVKQNQNIGIDLGNYNSYITYAIWIDYNQDGVFNNTDERVFRGNVTGNYGYVSGNFTIPCTALPGSTRMRIRGGDWYNTSSAISSACGDIGLGETEDYDVFVIGNPISLTSMEPTQNTGVVAPSTLDKVILKVPVTTNGCGTAINTNMRFSTAGSTSAANISNAKLYRTSTSSFTTSNLLSTVATPSGQFTFVISDTLVPSGTTYYWLTYDVSGSAVLSNVLDARLDSMQVMGSYYKPLNGNPSGNLQILAPMTYLSGTTTQDNTQKVSKGTTNNEVLGVQIAGSSTGAPLNVTQLDFTANGTTDTSEIENIKVWYTGNSKVFMPTTQYGNTLSRLPGTYAFTITGVQPLANDTNYFWLTYDVKSGAVTTNVIDGECTGLTVGGVAQVPTVTAPTGNRVIKNPSCVPVPGGSPFITNISVGTMNFYPPSNFSSPYYRIFAPNVATTNLYMSNTTTLTVTSDGDAVLNAWIDFDDDGVFGPSEIIPITMSTGGGFVPASTTFVVPCTVAPGSYSMRVMSRVSGNPNTDPCRSGGSGEAIDLTVTVVSQPMAFNQATAVQQTGSVSAGMTDKPVLKVPVLASGCGVATATEFRFSTTGTTSAANITSAKLYRTGLSDAFSTTTLLGTVPSPSGQFTFMVSDTLEHNEATNYWLAYDISASAATSNVLDARFDSVQVLGAYHTPIVSNPAGNLLITSPMTYVSSTVTQNTIQKVGRGDVNSEVIGIMVRTSSTGAPIEASQLSFNTNGTTDTANVRNMKVWYTGTSNRFATTTQFGSTLAILPGVTSFSISGTQTLLNDTNYFWLTYDVEATSTIGNLIDGECTSITVDGISQTPTVTNPTGSRTIREKYCDPLATSGLGCSWGQYISYVGTSGATTDLNVSSACNPAVNGFGYYPSVPFVVTKGQSIHMTVGDYSSYNTYAVWIDFDQDGVFSTSERVLRSTSTGDWGTLEGSFNIPAGALTGTTRMRVRGGDYWWFGAYINSPCNDIGVGETEDYNIEILPLPAAQTYVWNKTTPDDFTDASNWTPARNNAFANDKLVFNTGGSIDVYNVVSQSVSRITVSNNTTVNMDGSNNGTLLIAGDSLQLTSGKIVATSSLTIGVGYDTTTVGTVLGTGSVDGVMKRWINSSTTSYTFPLSANGKNNSMNLSYTTAPVGGTLTARVVLPNSSQAGLPLTDGAITINKVSPYGVWRLTSANGYSGGAFTGTFTAEGVTYVTNPADLRITRRIASIAAWTVDGTGLAGTGTITSPVLSRTGMSLLGEFGVGGDISVNSLPVTITSFNAAAVKENVLLTWTTVSELNNTGFDVERSVDGKHFTKVAFVKGSGNSSKTINYNQVDQNAFNVTNNNILYYRLRQIDFDGKAHVSEIVKVEKTAKALSSVNVYPNPFTSGLTVELVSTQQAEYTYSISDIQGKTIFTGTFNVSEGMNRVPVDQVDGLSSGIYFLHLQGAESTTLKVIKTH